jgi:glutamate/tyrosine decarboxylase-like PLP-dependent enzyme
VEDQGIDIPLHIDGASGGFVWPFRRLLGSAGADLAGWRVAV